MKIKFNSNTQNETSKSMWENRLKYYIGAVFLVKSMHGFFPQKCSFSMNFSIKNIHGFHKILSPK